LLTLDVKLWSSWQLTLTPILDYKQIVSMKLFKSEAKFSSEETENA